MSLAFEGELTVMTAAEQHARLRAYLRGTGPFELDLSGVTELDTAGLQLLLAAHHDARQQGAHLTLRHPSPAVATALAVAHLDTESLGDL
ncbi:STAS domain-containing protein [Dactylosporangium sp. NPDC051485]|uniref:STAS domain-containing protein n=1 Tax=Dactylosporangium sp. NPDC051485 TaxID=3154846 RepID=UPI00341D7A4B